MGIVSFVCPYGNIRLDLFLKTRLLNNTRAYIQKLILSGNVTVNGLIVKKPAYKLKEGSALTVKELEIKKTGLSPVDYNLEIIYEDDCIAVINKPAGITVHPGKGNYDNTLVNILIGKISNLSGIGGVERPGIVHRLDKDTSGIMLIAKNDFSHNALISSFKNREIKKTYLAICYGLFPQKDGCIEGFIKRDVKNRIRMQITKETGKYCLTRFETIRQIKGIATLLKVMPHTGRTHQIRVSLFETGHPIVGDKVYKRKDASGRYKSLNFVKRQMLHAYMLEFFHPKTGEKMALKAEVPCDMLWAFDSGDKI
ncbi:MAG: RluA family pseudouridine synthase [Deltaproteobacteria bacterium]|nr:RluA family pseudouridine synthase [Deltaproteobacteria bacterium]MCL5892247.1 RluA family pseudouridine synthase [Deltaproteobacteria bacterium]